MNKYQEALDNCYRYLDDDMDCHFLEMRNSLDDLQEYCDEFEEALDKACEILASKSNIMRKSNYDIKSGKFSKRQWKEWLLNNE